MGALRRADVRRFAAALADRLPGPLRIVLTGGAQALMLGGTRPTADIDFEVVVTPQVARRFGEIERAIREVASATGVLVQFSQDIDRWSSISIPSRHRRSRPLFRKGRLTVHVLEPACFAVYKLARYFDSDVEDVIRVLRREQTPAERLARLAGKALATSPRSTRLFPFRRQVEDFFRRHGRNVWGREFDPEKTVRRFHAAAGIHRR